jgi:hypothetical protein
MQAVFSRPVIALGADWGQKELPKELVRAADCPQPHMATCIARALLCAAGVRLQPVPCFAWGQA